MKKLKIFTLVLFLLTGSALAASEYYHYRAEDRTLPVLRCPDEPLVISVGENSREKLLEGVTAWDDKDGDLTERVLIQGIAKTIEGSETTITYAVVDSDAHVAHRTRTVRYTDYAPPKFALSRELRYSVGTAVQIRDRLTATDLIDGDVSERIKVTSSGLSAYAEGTYPVTFEVTNSLGDTASFTADIVIRNQAQGEPRIYLTEYLVYLARDAVFQPMEYLESVTYGAEETVTVDAQVDTSVPGTYRVRYTCAGPTGTEGTAALYVVVE